MWGEIMSKKCNHIVEIGLIFNKYGELEIINRKCTDDVIDNGYSVYPKHCPNCGKKLTMDANKRINKMEK